jgi:endogenous inhibitor of DNA gyrase (YacG/DUF329 family)
MYIPELPFLAMSFKAKCPECGSLIGGHIVKEKFTCPFCGVHLVSNKQRAFYEACSLAVLVYALLAVLANYSAISVTWRPLAMLGAGLGPIVVGWGYFRLRLRVEPSLGSSNKAKLPTRCFFAIPDKLSPFFYYISGIRHSTSPCQLITPSIQQSIISNYAKHPSHI